MVQLIRITTNDPAGLFNNQFNDDLIIEKNSKVALHSMTCEISTKQITIDAQNDGLSFKMQGGGTVSAYTDCFLKHGIYTASNIDTLLTDTTTVLNKGIEFTNGNVGRQWSVDNIKGKINFDIKVGRYVQPQSTDPNIMSLVGLQNVAKNTPNASNWYSRSAGTAGTTDAFMWFKSPNCKGACSFSSRVYQRTNNEGFILAYLAEPPNTNTAVIDTADILYGIEFVGTAALPNGATPFYRTYYAGAMSISTVQPVVSATAGDASNDYLSLDTGEGKITGRIYRQNGAVQLFEFVYDHITDLFPVIIFTGDTNAGANGIKYNSDPMYNVSNTISFSPVIPTEDQQLGIPSNGSNANSSKAIKFADIDLALIMGFKQTEYVSPPNMEWNLLAENAFSLSDLADSFVIELMNIPLNSYDGLTHQRRNILHTVVQTDMVRERLTYIAPYPLYIDMQNATKLSLREVRARILREDLNAVNLNGFSQITILISQ